VATVVCETSMPTFKSSPRILRYPHLGFPRPNRRISSLIAGSRGGRPGRRHGPRGRLPKELSVPSEEGVRADQEAPPPVPGEQPGPPRPRRPIGGGEARSRSSSSENLQLASEHDRLEIALINATADEQTEQTR
jgi:hypothetical protein